MVNLNKYEIYDNYDDIMGDETHIIYVDHKVYKLIHNSIKKNKSKKTTIHYYDLKAFAYKSNSDYEDIIFINSDNKVCCIEDKSTLDWDD